MGVIFESTASKYYRFMAKYFQKDPEFKEMMIRFAEDDWTHRQAFKKMVSELENNPKIFIDESDYQHVRMLMPEQFIKMDWDHPESMSARDALLGVMKFEEKAMKWSKDVMMETRGFNQPLKPLLPLVEMIRSEEKHLAQVQGFYHQYYPMA